MSLFPLVVFSVEFKPFIRRTYIRLILLTCAAHCHTGQKSIHIKAYIDALNLWRIYIVVEANLSLCCLELVIIYLTP